MSRECSTLCPSVEQPFANRYPGQLTTCLPPPVLPDDRASEHPVILWHPGGKQISVALGFWDIFFLFQWLELNKSYHKTDVIIKLSACIIRSFVVDLQSHRSPNYESASLWEESHRLCSSLRGLHIELLLKCHQKKHSNSPGNRDSKTGILPVAMCPFTRLQHQHLWHHFSIALIDLAFSYSAVQFEQDRRGTA